MRAAGINHTGQIQATECMSGLEQNPKEDWLYLALQAFQAVATERGPEIRKAAFIGTGNGIDAIAALNIFPSLQDIYVNDLLFNDKVRDILSQVKENIRNNAQHRLEGENVVYFNGRDCEKLDDRVDLIYANLPLVTVDGHELDKARATTTLTDAAAYMPLATKENERLRRYSLLSQLGFLKTAKEKLSDSGVIITLIGGRIPYEITEECFRTAGLEHKLFLAAFKKQSDPEFLEEYAAYETKEGIQFVFYDYGKAAKLLKAKGFEVPEVIRGYNDARLKDLLKPAEINAKQAYQLAQQGRDVGHLAYAFVAYKPRHNQNGAA